MANPIPPKQPNPLSPDKSQSLYEGVKKPNPDGPPAGKPIVPPPGTKPITDGVLYGGQSNGALSAGPQGSAVFDAVVPEFVFAGHFIALCITDSDNNSRVRIIKLLKGFNFYCTSEVFTNPRELRSDWRPPQKQKVQNKPHKCSRRQMVCGTHDWIIYEALILRRYESV